MSFKNTLERTAQSLLALKHARKSTKIWTCQFCQRRGLTTSHNWIRSNSRISTVFGALVTVGFASTAYGVYQFYSMFTMWPEEIRGDLRAGIKARNRGEYDLSERYLRRAYETALTLPLSSLSPYPHLKLSGIAITLASMLESANKPEMAYEIYADALDRLHVAQAASSSPSSKTETLPEPLSGQDRMRVVQLASKLGEMAEEYQLPVEAEERWLTLAVEEMLRVIQDEGNNGGLIVSGGSAEDENTPVMLAELEMPSWVSKADVGAPLEALGRFYSREGNVEYAIPLYLQAISLLVPPPSSKKKATVEEHCRGAQLMNNLAELSIRGEKTDAKRKQAEAWARKGLITAEKAKESGEGEPDEVMLCEEAIAAILFNLGSLLEMDGDGKQSKELYQQSLDQAKSIKMREGIIEAQAALRRIDRASRHTPKLAQ